MGVVQVMGPAQGDNLVGFKAFVGKQANNGAVSIGFEGGVFLLNGLHEGLQFFILKGRRGGFLSGWDGNIIKRALKCLFSLREVAKKLANANNSPSDRIGMRLSLRAEIFLVEYQRRRF